MRNGDEEMTWYPGVRRAMGRARETLDDAGIEHMLAELFPDAEPEDVENFVRAFQKFGRQVAPVAQRALPGVIKGAMTGATVAGPWGALAGAVGGGAASLIGGGAQGGPSAPRQPTAARAMSPTPWAAPPGTRSQPVASPAGRVPQARASASSAAAAAPAGAPAAATPAAQLLTLLSRPETMNALVALLLSGAGRPTVAVGQRQVPAAAFANALSELAAEAAEASGAQFDDGVSDFLLDESGNARCDIVNPADRARLLLADLAEVAAAEAHEAEDMADAPALEELYEEAEELYEEAEDLYADAGDPLDAYYAVMEGEEINAE